MPKVSVILPAYNGEKFIAAAIDSVLSQTYKDYEVIVVNDGSVDGTARILDKYAGKIRVVSQENGGIAKARNVAIENSKGEYLAFLDQDDLWLSDKLELQVPLMEKNKDVGLTYTDAHILCDNNTEFLSFGLRKPYRGMVVENLLLNNFIATSSVMVRKECFEKVGLFDQTLSPCLDYDIWLKIASIYKADYADRPLVKFRDHVSTFRKNEIFTIEKIIETLERFIDEHPEIRRNMGIKIDQKIANYYIGLGNKYFAKANFKVAFSKFNMAFKLNPSLRAFLYIIASVPFELTKNVLRSIKAKIKK